MKVAITGGKGNLGGYVAAAFRNRECQAFPFSHDYGRVEDPPILRKALDECQPDVVIHLAALTDLGLCERDKELAHLVNVVGTKNVAEQCAERKIPVVFVSTYYLYASDDGEPKEEDAVIEVESLPNYYTTTKYEAEHFIRQNDLHYIVRLGSLYGSGLEDKKFIGFVCSKLIEGESIKLVNDRFIQPTASQSAADRIADMVLQRVPYGTYNIVSQGHCSFYQCGSFIARLLVGDYDVVRPISADEFPVTVQQKYVVASNAKLATVGIEPIPQWQVDLRRYIEEIKNGN